MTRHLATMLALAYAGCSRQVDPWMEGDRMVVAGQFAVDGRKYVLGADDACTIYDHAILYTADFGAREIHYGNRTVKRNLFVGRTDPFELLEPAERKELVEAAKAGLDVVQGRIRKGTPRTELDERRRACLTAFLSRPD